MKLHHASPDIERIGEMQTERNFSIKATGKAFRILSSGLYKEKILAIIRELSCNALDAHIANLIHDVPFEVHLPTLMEPYFSVRDYGPGLSPDDMINIYTTYFESTKTGSDDFIGALGLGCKSPLSYVDSFPVTSFHGGYKRTYTVFFDEFDTPTIIPMASAPHIFEDGHGPKEFPHLGATGLEVMIPVKTTDIAQFTRDAQKVFAYFNPAPRITGNAQFEIPVTTPIMVGNGFKVFNHVENAKTKAIMGVVAYPLEFGGAKDFPADIQALMNTNMEIEFPIGSLDVTAGREDLSYDKRTIGNILTRLETISAELAGVIQTTINACENEYLARCFVNQIKNNPFTFAAFPEGVPYRDTDILVKTNEIEVNLQSHHTATISEFSFNSSGGVRIKKQTAFSTPGKKSYFAHRDTVFFYDDLVRGQGSAARLRNHRLNGISRSTKMVVFTGDAEALAFLRTRFGNVKITPVSELPKPVRATSTGGGNWGHGSVRPKHLNYIFSGKLERSDLRSKGISPEDGGFYVNYHAGNITRPDGSTIDHEEFGNFLMKARELGLYDFIKDEVVFLPKTLHPAFLNGKHKDEWVCLFSHVTAEFEKKRAKDNWDRGLTALRKTRFLSADKDYERCRYLFGCVMREFQGVTGQPFDRFRALFTDNESRWSSYTDMQHVVADALKIDLSSDDDTKLKDEWYSLMEEYPAVMILTQHRNENRGFPTDGKAVKAAKDYIDLIDSVRPKKVRVLP